MIPVMISELRGWASNFSKTSISAFTVAVAIGGGLSLVQPRASLILLVLMLTWLGWAAGLQKWEILKAWAWIKREGLAPAVYVAGKFAAGVILGLIHIAFALPVVVLMIVVWGLPLEVFLAAAGIGLLSYLVALAMGLAMHRDGALLGGLPSGFVIFVWSVLCIGLVDLRPFSPFMQLWNLLGDGSISYPDQGSALGNTVLASADNSNGLSLGAGVFINVLIVGVLFGLAILRQSVWKKR